GRDWLPQPIAPGAKRVGPRLDGERPATDRIRDERSVPAVGVEVVGHPRRPPGVVVGTPVQHARAELVVAFLDQVRANPDGVASDALRRMPPGRGTAADSRAVRWPM